MTNSTEGYKAGEGSGDQPTTPPPTADSSTASRRRGRRPGGQPSNSNAVTHGMRASGLPRGCQRVKRAANEFSRSLCQAVEARGVKLADDLAAMANINTAVRWETVAQLAARWLRLHHDEMTHDQRLAYARQVATASENRDKCIRALRLDSNADHSPAALYAALRAGAFDVRPAEPQQATEPTEAADASNAAVGVPGGNGSNSGSEASSKPTEGVPDVAKADHGDDARIPLMPIIGGGF